MEFLISILDVWEEAPWSGTPANGAGEQFKEVSWSQERVFISSTWSWGVRQSSQWFYKGQSSFVISHKVFDKCQYLKHIPQIYINISAVSHFRLLFRAFLQYQERRNIQNFQIVIRKQLRMWAHSKVENYPCVILFMPLLTL